MRTIATRLLLTVAIGVAGLAAAADLPRFLPAETLLAIGVEGLAQHEAKAQPFIDEWERLNLTALLEAAFAEEGDEPLAVPDLGVDLLDLLGREAWVAISASQFNPLPTLTVLAVVTPDGMSAVEQIIAEATAEGQVDEFTEGSIGFTVVTPVDEEMPTPIVYALFDDVVLVSSNPDVARGVLRRYQGASEPSLATNSGYLGTVGALRSGNAYLYLDLPAVTGVVTPFAAGMGFDALVNRLTAAATTAGVYGTVTTITDDGIETVGVRVLGSSDRDPRLHALLAPSGAVSDRVMAFVPPSALGVSAGRVDLPGWWAWLEDVVASEPSIGIDDLDGMIAMSFGLDLQSTLFGWMGDEYAAVTLGYGVASAMPTELVNPLGETVYLIEADDEAAAAAGLDQLFTMVTAFASSFMDPMGEGGMVQPVKRGVGGVSVTDWPLADGFVLSVAVTDGYALVATSQSAIDAVLGARAGGAGLSAALSPLRGRVPQGVTSYTLSDDQAALAYTAQTLVEQLGMMSGMAGGDIDFDAVEAASAALAEYLEFVTDRIGGSLTYTTVDGSVVRTQGYSYVNW